MLPRTPQLRDWVRDAYKHLDWPRPLPIIIAIGMLYGVLVLTYIGALNAFWSTDQGVKLIQTQSLILARFRSSALQYPGAELDPAGQFSPFRGQYLVRGDQTFGMFPQAFSAISAAPLFVFGYAGLYLVPIVAACGVLVALAALGKLVLTPVWNVVLVVLAGLCSPLIFYAANFWEHTTALCFVAFALLLGCQAIVRARPALLLAAGACAGLAVWFRNETALVFPSLIIALWLGSPLPRVRSAALLGAGGAIAITPLLLFNYETYGSALGAHVLVTGVAERLTLIAWASFLLVPGASAFIGLALLGLGLLAGLSLLKPQLRSSQVICYGFSVLTILLLLQIAPPSHEAGYTSLLTACPLVLLCLLPAGQAAHQNPTPAIIRVLGLFALGFILLCWLVRIPDGGNQHGPRMLLPAVMPLLVVGVWRASNWLQSNQARNAFVACLLTLMLVVYASATAQIAGMRQLRYTMNDNYLILAGAAHSQQRVIITDTWPAGALLAPLMYDGHVIFQVDSSAKLDQLLGVLRSNGIEQFYYLGIFDAKITGRSEQWKLMRPLGERKAFAYQLRGQSFGMP